MVWGEGLTVLLAKVGYVLRGSWWRCWLFLRDLVSRPRCPAVKSQICGCCELYLYDLRHGSQARKLLTVLSRTLP